MNVGDYGEWRRSRFDRSKYACFRCRICLKWPHERAASVAVAGRSAAFARPLPPPVCARCRGLMTDVGYTFEAPGRTDVRAWRLLGRRWSHRPPASRRTR